MAKKYKCPYCENRLTRKDLIDHIDKKHEEMIPERFTSSQIVFDIANGTNGHGKCRVCGAPTNWNQSSGRYDVLCLKPSCKQKMRDDYKKNMLKVYGTYNILNDDEQQKKMLANRSISGKYRFSDGAMVTYTGNYERKFLEFADKVMQIPSKDIIAPGPTIEYEMNGEKHFYITDFLYVPYNAIIEIKDGGHNPNNKDSEGMRSSRQRTLEKERLITKQGIYHYLRLTDNNFMQLLDFFMDIKKGLLEGIDDKVVNINESAIDTFISYTESTKSSLNSNYKPKGKKNLSSFKMVHITPSIIEKYKKQYPFLKHVRCKDTNVYICDGYMWFDGDVLVATVGSCEYKDDGTKWVVSLEITPEYHGYGLSKQILDYAVKKMNCKYLSVNKNNKIAKSIYDKYGFKTYEQSDAMYYMTLDNSVKESAFINKKDINVNIDKFESGKSNVLLITGLSGSGKSTLASGLAKKYGAYNFELDCLNFYLHGIMTEKQAIDGDEIGLLSFIKSKNLKPDKNISSKDEVILYREYIKYLINYCKKHKEDKFIIEGLQIYEIFEDGDTFITSCPIIIKGTSGLVSSIRAAKRNDGSFIKEIGPLLKWALKDSKYINSLRKALKESSDLDYTKFDAYHLELDKDGFNKDPRYHCWDEELYYKNIESAVKDVCTSSGKVTEPIKAHCYVAGNDLTKFYLGVINIYPTRDGDYNWEWDYTEPISEKDYEWLIDHPMCETAINNFFMD